LWIAEGPSGYWIFAGLLDNVLYKVTPQKQVSVFLERAGYTGNDPEHVGAQTRSGRSHVLLIGPSCTGMDHQGRVIWCADNDRHVMRLEKDGTHTVFTDGSLTRIKKLRAGWVCDIHCENTTRTVRCAQPMHQRFNCFSMGALSVRGPNYSPQIGPGPLEGGIRPGCGPAAPLREWIVGTENDEF
jgi:hypothetical protein